VMFAASIKSVVGDGASTLFWIEVDSREVYS
jgi:hypothetical protein